MARVVVGLSGGVDSSVAAHILQEQGHEVIALFMRNWHDDSVILDDDCPWVEDSNDALLVADKLNIPFQVIDLSEEYKERIVDYMFAEYESGRTPNPDVLCNREIKFDTFLKAAMELGADYVATGHYCRKDTIEVDGKPVHRLLAGVDNTKDQSYFLCQLNQEQLSKALFPIGHLQKSEVRKIAMELNLVTAEKKDSQGLCFIGKVSLPTFLQQQLKPKKGKIIEVTDADGMWGQDASKIENDLDKLVAPYVFSPERGKVVGEHQGAHYFTVGQRKGLAVGGTPEPLFVLATDTTENLIYTGQGEHHRALSKKGLFIAEDDIHWVRPDLELKEGESSPFLLRIRYRQQLVGGTLYRENKGLYIIFDEPMKAITPGQFAAWYLKDELVGSGVINY
ncbi:tRNA (5-methylaminomethyl-2-thiouridylate)-methyltransferase [Owenweeksia hongkongensis DSM 17368]|uniref:tRNA-specific 2-thiouridylase MnmA n=1 Tax=Owenweeksia hongkongensis (strain DSM 17368 / CIP 108786 / JCM 12287 / NRRL B-23963 / UST20020801) TaxID=926562 RepID=G8R6L5_OWEHD|nr:tRNA 2-thiouridine(34) synthase MnmA [Owenweeksia hongkongensis]AEV31158.1 tRNA (5-methylaminomethyl-2-thiouridylate)-methyltransferase [Owenweeksia hongkongensis DSM 17368]